MTATATPYDAICAAVARHRGDRADGALLAVFLDRRNTVVLTIGFDEGTSDVDELFLRHVVAVVSDIQIATVVFAVWRVTGRPTRVDRVLWRELHNRLSGATTELRDVIVIGEQRRWSATTGSGPL